MDQTVVSQSGDKKPRSGCFIFGLVAVGGLLALALLAGAAYFLGYFPIPALSQPTPEPLVTEAVVATDAATVEAVSTNTPEPTVTPEPKLPSVEAYDATFGIQYPSIALLADGSSEVSILPNQPTALTIRWCAKNASILSKNTTVLNATYTIDGVELPISSFSVYQSQTMLEVANNKKDFAVCNNLSGLIRDWSEGDHTVSFKLVATKDYDDGWKKHKADEVIEEGSFTVHVTSFATPAEWNRCEIFENVKMELVFLAWKPKEPLAFYLIIPGGVPGLERDISGDTGTWEYSATVGTLESEDSCTFEGYENKLYCKVTAPSDYSNSIQPLTVSVNGCSWPIYSNTDTEIPGMSPK